MHCGDDNIHTQELIGLVMALQAGMQEMSEAFRELGAEIYHDEAAISQSSIL